MGLGWPCARNRPGPTDDRLARAPVASERAAPTDDGRVGGDARAAPLPARRDRLGAWALWRDRAAVYAPGPRAAALRADLRRGGRRGGAGEPRAARPPNAGDRPGARAAAAARSSL